MTTPTKEQIIERARELWHIEQARNGNPAFDIEPELDELREGGFLAVAQSELMRSPNHDEWDGYNERVAYSQKTLEKELDGSIFAKIIRDIKEHLGLIVVAESGHGKSFTAFTLAKEAMKDPDITVVILSPSTVWRRKFGKINCVKVGTDFNPIVSVNKKWKYINSKWFEGLLWSKQNLLFEIKYKDGRRIKNFESEVLKVIYDFQEQQMEQNPKYNHHFLICLEEIQNSFGTYSMVNSLDLMTMFTQSRSDALIHYIGICQRLADVSTKAVERLRPLIGLTLGENSLRKIRAQIPKHYRARIQHLPVRHWIYLDGKTNPEITIPKYTRKGKPSILKPKLPNTETSKPTDPYILAMKPRAKRSSLRSWLKVLRFLFWVDYGDLRKTTTKPIKPETETDEANEVEEEDEFPISEI